jgi:hypothetical protein
MVHSGGAVFDICLMVHDGGAMSAICSQILSQPFVTDCIPVQYILVVGCSMLLVYWWPEISRYPSETRTLTQ